MCKTPQTYELPDHFICKDDYQPHEVIIRHHSTSQTSQKNKIVLNMHMINILISGSKTILHPSGIETISDQELVLLPQGHMLTSEIIAEDKNFESLVIYFDNEILTRFLLQFELTEAKTNTVDIIFRKDNFLSQYTSALLLLTQQKSFPAAFKELKLYELLYYLAERQPNILSVFRSATNMQPTLRIQEVVQQHICNDITVEELAFLCHMSLSSFKRKFHQLYHTTPKQWLISKKLELAHQLLKQPSNTPSSIYLQVGYQNHSSFTQAFKARYGCTPSAYHAQHLDV